MARTSGSSSRERAISAFARVMSADTVSWKTGTCHASVRRRAIVRRMLESGTAVSARAETSSWVAGGPTAAGATAARSTSSATTRPSGPVPVTAPSSIPRSRAIRRASGDAFTRPPASSRAPLVTARNSPACSRRLDGCLRGRSLHNLASRFGRDVRKGLAFASDDCNRLTHRHLALDHGDPEEDAARLGLDLLGRLVGVDLEQRLALLDGVTLGLEPTDDRAALHPLPEPRELDVGGHQARATVFLIAARTSAG